MTNWIGEWIKPEVLTITAKLPVEGPGGGDAPSAVVVSVGFLSAFLPFLRSMNSAAHYAATGPSVPDPL